MTLRPEQVIGKLSSTGSQCERIDEHVVRCTRRYHDNEPYAVYYFDLHGELPNSEDAVLGLQEHYLSEGFFGGPKHLRWNHYFVFVVDDKKWPSISTSQMRDRIERDTTYARKVVLPERELDQFARQHELFKEHKAPDDPTAEWRKALKHVGLEQVVFAKTRGPTVAAWIDGIWKPRSSVIERDANIVASEEDGKRLLRIKWERFREWPKPKDFVFGSVNLISGVNGAGKTGLLEAIEYFYCGEGRRNGAPEAGVNDIKAVLDGAPDLLRLDVSASAKRQRDLRWFGAYSRGTNELVENFNRYLFFNADSSYSLEHSDGGMFASDALARVALGPAAMDLWGRMQEFHKEFESQSIQLDRQRKRLSVDVANAKTELARLRDMALVAEKKLEALRKAMSKIPWKQVPKTLEDFESRFASQILEAFERTQIWDELSPPYSSIEAAEKEARSLALRIDQAKSLLKQLNRSEQDLARFGAALEAQEKVVDQIRRLGDYWQAGWRKATSQLEGLDARLRNDTAAVEEVSETRGRFTEYERTLTVDELSEAISRDMKAKAAEVAQRKAVIQEEQSRISKLEHILSEAAALGKRLIDVNPDCDECPLCGQSFAPGKLAGAIKGRRARLTPKTQASSASLVSLSDLERSVEKQGERSNALKAYRRFEEMIRETRKLPVRVSLGELESLEAEIKAGIADLRRLRAEAKNRLSKLAEEGMRAAEYEHLVTELLDDRVPESDDAFDRRLSSMRARAKEKLDADREKRNSEKALVKATKEKLSTLLQTRGADPDYEERIDELLDLQETLKSAISVASEVEEFMKLGKTEDLRAKQREIAIVNDLANDISQSISSERARIAAMTSLEERYKGLLQQENSIKSKQDRATSAAAALEGIFKTMSLNRLVAKFVDANRPTISNILRVIHAPREFSGIAPLENEEGAQRIQLMRNDGRSAQLSEISAGQRAAVALAVFIALNEKIKAAPPIMLMDDPIAHVDDLNMLAFLDVMREIVASGKRQLFFATANKKLSGIFEQKFHAFTSDFRKIALERAY
jgi:DNA repair protein SbcC/Rad50